MEGKERADLDAFNALDPPARALVLDILRIFVDDALAAPEAENIDVPARRTPPTVPAQRSRAGRTGPGPTFPHDTDVDERPRGSGRSSRGVEAGRTRMSTHDGHNDDAELRRR